MRDQVIQHILDGKIIAIVRGLDVEPLTELVSAFERGGVKMVEITFDQSHPDLWAQTCEGIRRLSETFAGRVDVGAGTVLTKEQLDLAREAGAKYIISPDANPEIIRYTRECGLVSIPGCMTPTDMTAALDAGADFIKVFPAGILGPDYIKAVKAPLSHAKMLAVGGINDSNAGAFMRAGCKGIGVGGNLVNKKWIACKEFDRIEESAKKYVEAVNNF